MFKFIDLFAGIWWFHLALSNIWWECVFASDIDEECRKTYEANHKLYVHWDITKINEKDIPSHDILCGGFPCQPFSISGKQKWFSDDRWNLFFDIVRIIKYHNPKVVFLENVKNLKYHDKGNTLKVILDTLNNLWYKVSWDILNSKDYWCWQNRERIIIIGSKNNKFDFSKLSSKKEVYIKNILDKNWDFEYLDENDYTIIDKKLWKKQKSGLIFCWYRNKWIRKNWVLPNTEHLSRVHKQPNRIYHIDWVHPTIPSQESAWRFWIYDWKKVRKLTINECFKLMWFPEKFKKCSIKAKLYNQIGNSVSISMIESVAKEILSQLIKK